MKALICGISGQDGGYLARFLLDKGYEVYGTSRDAQACSFNNLKNLGIFKKVSIMSMAMNDFRSVFQVIDSVCPDEIYNLAGQTSVALSFEQPVETMDSINIATLNLLEVIRFTKRSIKFYNAGSSECFGDTGDMAANESTAFHPMSPYAVAKASAYWITSNYRDAYNLFACTGILFNHESPLRPERFVTRKIVCAACRIAAGSKEKLHLGNTAIRRDWGWAPEYIEAMWLMMQASQPEDYVIATGKSYSLHDFVRKTFAVLGLDWKPYVVKDPKLLRPSDIAKGKGNPEKAKERLGWIAKNKMGDVVRMMVEAELNSLEIGSYNKSDLFYQSG